MSGQICQGGWPGCEVRLIHQDNQGLSGARNTGLGTQCELFDFVDSDDWLPGSMLPVFMKSSKEYDADIAIGHHCSFRAEDSAFLYYSTEHFETLYTREEIIEYPRRRMLDGVSLCLGQEAL